MSRDEFDALVRRLEVVSQANPKGYLTRVVGLVLLVYGFLALLLLGSLALVLGCLAIMIAVPNAATIKLGIVGLVAFGGFFFAIARGLWVKLEPPDGQRVTREQAPALFSMLDELRAALRCQPFHEVQLMGDHNAAVIQIPRLGMFGWHRNYLLIGLPLMQSLAPDEFKAVLAHEFAHSSRGHGRFGNWLYRVRRTWDRIFEQMAKQGTRGSGLLLKFLNWFWPLFNAHAFVLARANEYEADACSVRLAGADAAARALSRLPVDGNLLSEKFWPDIYALANHQKEPPANVMISLQHKFKAGAPEPDASRWLRQAFLIETNNSDTHPCLKDRLRAMGRLPVDAENNESPVAPTPPSQSAAEVYLGPHAEVAARQLSDEWRKDIERAWAERHVKAQKLTAELAELEKPGDAPPSVDLLWKRARVLIDLHGDEKALPALEQVLTLDGKHAGANFVRGRQLLEKDDLQGVNFMEAALASDPLLTEDALQVVYGYYVRSGQRDKLRLIEDRVDKFREQAQQAHAERGNITAADTFLPPELSPGQLSELRAIMANEGEIGGAAVARKQVMNFPQSPCYVIALKLNVAWWKPRGSTANQQLVDRVVNRVQLPGNFLVFVAADNLKALGSKIFAVPGAVVYERAGE
jgi:Zn-dependent protease with chaperone function